MAAKTLTAERLRELLDYDPETGIFTNRSWRGGTARAGERAGRISKQTGYLVVDVDGRRWQGHQLAWLFVYGELVKGLDHKDGVKSNNSINNLRPANKIQNGQNRWRANSNNQSGFLGVSWDPRKKSWAARITVGSRYRYLGNFPTPEEASVAYMNAKMLHYFIPNTGDFRSDLEPVPTP